MEGKFYLNCRKLLRLPQNGIRMNPRPICLGTDTLKKPYPAKKGIFFL
jgi:hypothetical protein